jgi:hypothetical protein
MQRVATSIRIMTPDQRHGTQSEETATGRHGPTARATGSAAICLGKRANALQQWTRAGARDTAFRSPLSRPCPPRRRELQPGGLRHLPRCSGGARVPEWCRLRRPALGRHGTDLLPVPPSDRAGRGNGRLPWSRMRGTDGFARNFARQGLAIAAASCIGGSRKRAACVAVAV